jgi:hypothetical protein
MNNNKISNKNGMILQYIRSKGKLNVRLTKSGKVMRRNGKPVTYREKGSPKGVLIAEKVNGEVLIGWSCARTGVDPFDKNLGLQIARARALDKKPLEYAPHSVQKELTRFVPRINKYFRVENPVEI